MSGEIKLDLDKQVGWHVLPDELRALSCGDYDGKDMPLGLPSALRYLADSIEEQVSKPALDEPSGDVVVVTRSGWFFTPGGTLGWVRDDRKPYTWEQVVEFIAPTVYRNEAELTELSTEVLHVGIGEPQPQPVEELAGVLTDPGWDPNTDYLKGVEDFAAKVRREIAALRSTVVTGPEKRTCDDALALVAALLGES